MSGSGDSYDDLEPVYVTPPATITDTGSFDIPGIEPVYVTPPATIPNIKAPSAFAAQYGPWIMGSAGALAVLFLMAAALGGSKSR